MNYHAEVASAIVATLIVVLVACTRSSPDQKAMESEPAPGTFAYDRAFLKKYKDVIELGSANSQSRLLIIKDYQGRVMTSTANGEYGNSYGWINYDLIESGEIRPQINPFGGEDRFWLGPEGGQYALYFKENDPFDFEHWRTPALIDTESFNLISADDMQATFSKEASFTNYAGHSFTIRIDRQVRLLQTEEIENTFGISLRNLKSVGYQSENSITNTGMADWRKENGLLSIWILGMFNPTDNTVIILPHEPGKPQGITDDYFGNIPAGRIIRTDNLLLLKGDGKYRSKVGIAPSIAKPVAGSYDAEKNILTLVKFDLDKTADYVNSKWEIQKEPYQGDVLNSYNDGRLADGGQLGPFYELESSSPVRELKQGEQLTHRHNTLHIEGSQEQLDDIAQAVLGISLVHLKSVFNETN